MIGVDASNRNPDLAYSTQLAGASFAIIKATEGLTFVDPTYAAKVERAREWSKLTGAYHFLRSDDDGAAQARFFLSVAQPLPGETLWCDWETTDGQTWAGTADCAGTFIATVNTESGARCGLYSDRYELVAGTVAATPAVRTILEAAPLWFADPDHPAGRPLSPLPWSLHQYGEQGGIDMNVTSPSFNWGAMAVPEAAPPPAPVPFPVPPIGDLDVPYLIRTPDGEIDLVLGAALVHLTAVELPAYAHLTQYPIGQDEGNRARAKFGV